MRRFFEGFVATLCIAAMLGFAVQLHSPSYWGLAVIVAFFLGALRAKGGRSTSGATSGPSIGSGFLCDSCKYNHPNTCSLPDRPNATRCADYKRRGA